VSTLRLHVGAAERRRLDADADFRDDFLRAASRVGLGRDQAVALVEVSSGRPFATCGATDLLPALDELLALVRSASTTMNSGAACNE
jgi:hypothetical protein